MFDQLRVGDTVIRMLAGSIPMRLTVSELTPDRIKCGEWEFNRHNGAEVDARQGWDGVLTTGSFLLPPAEIAWE